MNTNPGQTPNVYTTTASLPAGAGGAAASSPGPPNYSTQQPIYGQDQKYDYQQPQQPQQHPQQPQPAFGGQQYGGAPLAGPPPAPMGQQPQFQQVYPGNPVMTQGFYSPQAPVVVVQQQAPAPVVFAQQPVYGQFPGGLAVGGLTSGPGLVDCPRCGKRGLTNTTPVAGATTHIWAALCCFFLCLGCIPYLMTDMKDVEHNCSSCGAHVATWRR